MAASRCAGGVGGRLLSRGELVLGVGQRRVRCSPVGPAGRPPVPPIRQHLARQVSWACSSAILASSAATCACRSPTSTAPAPAVVVGGVEAAVAFEASAVGGSTDDRGDDAEGGHDPRAAITATLAETGQRRGGCEGGGSGDRAQLRRWREGRRGRRQRLADDHGRSVACGDRSQDVDCPAGVASAPLSPDDAAKRSAAVDGARSTCVMWSKPSLLSADTIMSMSLALHGAVGAVFVDHQVAGALRVTEQRSAELQLEVRQHTAQPLGVRVTRTFFPPASRRQLPRPHGIRSSAGTPVGRAA